ncbi:acyltransferase family protein [Suicoccus acidiformans]|nr:acyltransferase family protein [Suicoccus acidiformans]
MNQSLRLNAFDGAKGIAILGVILYHLFPQVFQGGFLFVNTFLVFAGYFFAYKMEKDQKVGQPIAWQALGRYVKTTLERLFIPLFWLILLILVGLYFLNRNELQYIKNDVISGLTFTNNIYQILADKSYFVQMAEASPFTHLWYNAIYLQSFLISVPLTLLTNKIKLNVPAKGLVWTVIAVLSYMLSVFLYEPGGDPSRVYYGLDTRFSSFAIGIAGAYLLPSILNFTRQWRWRRFFYNISALVILIVFFYLSFYASDQADITYVVWMPFFSFLSMFFALLITIRTPIASGFFDLKPLAALGRRSYTYYLWYYPVIVFYLGFYRELGENRMLINALSIVTILGLGEVFYRIIERADIRIWFGNHLQPLVDIKDMWASLFRNRSFLYKLPVFILYIAMLVVFVRSFTLLDNDKRLAQFKLEYQLYQTSTNVQDNAYPQERPLISIKEGNQKLDKDLDVAFLGEKAFEDPIREIQRVNRTLSGNIEALNEIISENQELLADVAETMPIVAEYLSPQEIKFATEVPVTIFGDSLALLSGPVALNLFQNGNSWGQASLQIWDAIPIYEEMIRDGEIQENVVIILGTNASLDKASVDDMVELSGDRQVFFVNTNSRVEHIAEVNEIIRQASETYDNVHEIDWYSFQQGHPEWYMEDEVHHSIEGMEYFTILTARKLYEVLGGQN